MCSMDVWSEVLEILENRLGTTNFEIWIKPIRLLNMSGNKARLEVPNRYYSDWVKDNHEEDILEGFKRVWSRQDEPPAWGPVQQLDFHFEEEDEGFDAPRTTEEVSDSREDTSGDRSNTLRPINPSHTFDNYVVGACNQFAHAAAEAVAEFPGHHYNPLFIYGCTGLGKTHLVHAVGNAILQREAKARVVYTTAETFVNQMINAIRFKKMEAFRERFRSDVDVLLIDDIQFLSGKDRSQEEFFHTFQALQTTGRHIVLTADVLPREIDKLEPRLRTRFEGGLLADIQPPDLETMLAILRKKADDLRLVIPGDLAEFVASRVRGNIRELEGVLNRLAALSNFFQTPLTLEFARQHLGNLYADESQNITAERVMESVARLYAIKVTDLKGSRKVKAIAYPRQIAMYVARQHTPLSFPDLGRAFCRDNSTVQYACKQIRERAVNDPDLRHTIETIERSLGV